MPWMKPMSEKPFFAPLYALHNLIYYKFVCFQFLPSFLEWISINQIIFFVILSNGFTPFIWIQEIILQISHLSSISQIHPTILVLLSGRNVPTPMLRINVIQMGHNKPMFIKGINTGQIWKMKGRLCNKVTHIIAKVKEGIERSQRQRVSWCWQSII